MSDPSPYNRVLGRLRLILLFLAVGVLLAFAETNPISLAMGLPLVIMGESIRWWSAGHLLKTSELVTAGPYRYSRNPLYLGRLLILSGLCLMVRLPYGLSWVVLVLGWSAFFGYYLPRKERVEPARLREIHGDAYARYFDAVPALWPRLTPYDGAVQRPWRVDRVLRNREPWMVVTLTLVTAFLFYRALG